MSGRKTKSESQEGEGSQMKKQKMDLETQLSSSSLSDVQAIEKMEPTEKAFSIDLIFKKISLCLNYNDLKILRLVSATFNTAVLNQTNFINKTVVNLLADDCSRLTPTNFGSTGILWKHFKIPFPFPGNETTSSSSKLKKKKEKFSWFYRLLFSAESIEISPSSNPINENLSDFPLIKILAAPALNTLKKLTIHANVLGSPAVVKSLTKLSKSSRAKYTLIRLQEFHISAVILENDNELYYEEENYDDLYLHLMDSIDLLEPYLDNLMVIKIENTNEYHKFESIENLPDLSSSGLHGSLYRLIQQNQNTLVQLHVFDMQMWLNLENAHLFNLSFPCLKSLSIKSCQQEKDITNFLDNQPELEELNITILNQFPIKVMRKIQQKGKNLKRLHVKTKGFDVKKVGMWNFLKNLNHLEDFKMDFIPSSRFPQNIESTQILLSCLPRSIKKLYLKGFGYRPLDDSESETESESDDNNDETLGQIVSGVDFERLDGNKLTHLTLKAMNIGNAVNNETMKFICKNFTMLQHLSICASGYQSDDFGFIGGEEQDELSTIKNLKGLRYLSLDCQNLTNRTYLQNFKFLELEHLKIYVKNLGTNFVEAKTIPGVLKSNPSLNTFIVIGEDVCFPEIVHLRSWNSRIKKVEAISEHCAFEEDESEHEDWI